LLNLGTQIASYFSSICKRRDGEAGPSDVLLDEYAQIIYPFAGISKHELFELAVDFKMYTQSILPLFYGLSVMNSHGYAHGDISDNNALFNPDTNKFAFIDFGSLLNSKRNSKRDWDYTCLLETKIIINLFIRRTAPYNFIKLNPGEWDEFQEIGNQMWDVPTNEVYPMYVAYLNRTVQGASKRMAYSRHGI
jgi:hypothetical protein